MIDINEEFIRSLAAYLTRGQKETGKFTYRARADGIDVKRDYNVLRHAGVTYSLSQAIPYLEESPQIYIDRGLDYLWKWYLVPIPGKTMSFGVASARPTKKGSNEVKLGGVALALLALASQKRIWSEFEKDVMRGLSNFACTLIAKNGETTSKIDFRTGAPSDFVSLYYPGEAAFGLLKYGSAASDASAVEHGLRILSYLAISRQNASYIPPDHWALLATAKAFELATNTEISISSELKNSLYQHACQVVEKIWSDAAVIKDDTGALTENGQTCSTATRLEGMCAIYPWLVAGDYKETECIEFFASSGIEYLRNAQFKKGILVGGVPWISSKHHNYTNVNMAPQVRVDSVQHSLSAMIHFIEMQKFIDANR